MRENEVQTLLICLNGDDAELSKYAKEKLLKHGVCRCELGKKESTGGNRIEDHDIFVLYNSKDSFLSMKARELTVRYHSRYLYYIMGKYFSGYEKEYSEDLYQCGVVGLLKSLTNYDGHYAISTYSRLYIIHEMTGFIYYLRNIPSPHYARIQNKIKAAETFLECSGAEVTDERISKEIGISLKSVKKERQIMKMNAPVSLDATPLEMLEKIFGIENTVEKIVLTELDTEYLKTVVSELPGKQQVIFCMKIYEEYSFGEIANILGTEKKKVYKKYYAALAYVKKRIKPYI